MTDDREPVPIACFRQLLFHANIGMFDLLLLNVNNVHQIRFDYPLCSRQILGSVHTRCLHQTNDCAQEHVGNCHFRDGLQVDYL